VSAVAVVACVDDFGASRSVNAAVLRLAARGAITATSCMVNMPHCDAAGLRSLGAAGIDVGLHLNLTEGTPLSHSLRAFWPVFPGLATVLLACGLGRVPRAALEDECRAQLERFAELAGRAPDFLDGHQHVHHVPAIRDGWLAHLERLAPGAYVRDTGRLVGPGHAGKRLLIGITGGFALHRRLAAGPARASGPLFGAYDFSAREYRARMQRWLAALAQRGGAALLFCHPADPAVRDENPDPIRAARLAEWEYFCSPSWIEDLSRFGACLVRGSAAFAPRRERAGTGAPA
jgi:hypothetical protein